MFRRAKKEEGSDKMAGLLKNAELDSMNSPLALPHAPGLVTGERTLEGLDPLPPSRPASPP